MKQAASTTFPVTVTIFGGSPAWRGCGEAPALGRGHPLGRNIASISDARGIVKRLRPKAAISRSCWSSSLSGFEMLGHGAGAIRPM